MLWKHYYLCFLVPGTLIYALLQLFVFPPDSNNANSDSWDTSLSRKRAWRKAIKTNYTEEQKSLNVALGWIKNYKEMVSCENIVAGDVEAIRNAKRWTFDGTYIWDVIKSANDRCATIKTMFAFNDRPLSTEEERFPLAYGMLLYKYSEQILFMLSALYQPQNQFCLAIDCKAEAAFREEMQIIADCFPNVHIVNAGPVKWCKFSVFKGVYDCLEFLAALKADWNYYQYLSGSDIPIKTNLEMVRIFKALNGSFNTVVAESRHQQDAPLTMFKSSLSATFHRRAAEHMVKHKKTEELLRFMSKKKYVCTDELFWTSLAGNLDTVNVPGGFNGGEFKRRLEQVYGTVDFARGRRQFGLYHPEKYYISRYQTWYYYFQPCYGKLIDWSCVYGIRDLQGLLARPELIAHKLKLDFQPATYLCLYEAVRRRTFDPNWEFDAGEYKKLPGPRIMAGEKVSRMNIMSPTGLDFF